ncbi:hypothetical protein [Hyphomonas oceanitis]|uniref:hypothetical protein n=1 Tax=Hyphomonas oceanitis TaxID=81033 RepID=UPI003001C7E3
MMRYDAAVLFCLAAALFGGWATAENYGPEHICYYDAQYYGDARRQDPSASAERFRQFLSTLPEGANGIDPQNSEENFPAIRAYIDANMENDASAASQRAVSANFGCYGYKVEKDKADLFARKAAELGEVRSIDYVARADSDPSTGANRSKRKLILSDGIQKLQETPSWNGRDARIESLEALYLYVDLLPKIQKNKAKPAPIRKMCQHFAQARDLDPRNFVAHYGLTDCYGFTGGWRTDLTLVYAHRLAYHWLSHTIPDSYTIEIERRLSSSADKVEAKRLSYQLTERPLPLTHSPLPVEQLSVSVESPKHASVPLNSSCNASVGEVIPMTMPSALFSQLNEVAAEKGEYESTSEYEGRVLAAQSLVRSWGVPNVEGQLVMSLASYDADSERFILPDSVLTLSKPSGFGMTKVGEFDPSPEAFSVRLSEAEHTDLGAYEASNAMGASVLVSKSHTLLYGVYDRPQKRFEASQNAPTTGYVMYPRLEYDEVIPAEASYLSGKPLVYLPVARELAADLKGRLKIAYSISLKNPFSQISTSFVEANFQNPREGVLVTRLLVADINCAMLIDDEQRLIRTLSVLRD